MNTTAFTATRFTQTTAALGLALVVTLGLLGSLNGLATEQHAATVMARAAATQQAQQAQQARQARQARQAQTATAPAARS